jgi:hypothetical protein
MCQITNQKLIEKVIEGIKQYSEEPKSLWEWNEIINKKLPKNRTFTRRELAHLFVVLRKKGIFNITHSGQLYAFQAS